MPAPATGYRAGPQSGALSQRFVRVTGRTFLPSTRMVKTSARLPIPDFANVIRFPPGEKDDERTSVPLLKRVSALSPVPFGRTT